MEDIFENFIRAGYSYSFEQGPKKVRSHEDARINGLNCVALAHLAMKDLFEYDLPAELHCLELFLDREHFQPVNSLDSMQRGDLVWFGFAEPEVPLEAFVPIYDEQGELSNRKDSALRHVGVFTGERDGENEPLILHATRSADTPVVWPLQRFHRYKRYGKIYGISRLKERS